MKLVLDKKQGNRVEFIATGASTAFANMIRRYALSRIPVMAIDGVTFYDNNSAFWDEYIAHRIGLIPIITPENVPEGAEIIFSCDAEGPKVVYASDMASSDKEIVVAKGTIPLITLGQGQHLRFEAKAVIGTAQKHSKYQAGLVSYGTEGDGLRFMVESFFQMEPSDVVVRACDLIEADLESVEEALGKKSEKKKKAEAKAEKKKAKEAKEEKKAKAAEEKEEAKEEKAEEKPAKKPKAKKAKAKEEKAEASEEKKE
ncbi:MAG: hypothetical protein V1827_05780 [Candidatus Micrarchaeota archaeon]